MTQCRGLALVLYWYLSVGETGGLPMLHRTFLVLPALSLWI
jgi:hypothetical protein